MIIICSNERDSKKKKGNERDFSIKQNYIRIAIHTGNLGKKKKKTKDISFFFEGSMGANLWEN